MDINLKVALLILPMAFIFLVACSQPQKKLVAEPTKELLIEKSEPETLTAIPSIVAEPIVSEASLCESGDPGKEPSLSGPYYHQVYMATSSDGFNFVPNNELLLEHASVPDALIRPDGEMRIYFVNGEPGRHGIWVAKPSDSGTWELIDCIRLDGKFNGNAVDPDIVILDDGRYRMFYFEGYFVKSAPRKKRIHPIFSAISDDGLNFKVEGQMISAERVTDPSVIQMANGKWLMALSHGDRTLLAGSDEGYDFDLTGVEVELGGVPELAVLADGNIRLYVTARGIKSLLSTDDGETWTVENGSRLSSKTGEIVADPSLITTESGDWILVYKVAQMLKPPPKPAR